MMHFTDQLVADHRAFLEQLERLQELLERDAANEALRGAVAAMRAPTEAHAAEEERLFDALEHAPDLDERTLAELRADHGRASFLFRSIAGADGEHLRNLCRTLIALLRYHIGCEETDLFPLAERVLQPSTEAPLPMRLPAFQSVARC